MDIIDVILGQALSPQGQIQTYAALAQQAVQQANAALNNIESITQQTNANNQAAQEALDDIQSAADTEIKKLTLTLETLASKDNSIVQNLITTYPDNTTTTLNNVVKYYNTTGDNTDGTMTQKAISNALQNANTNLGAQNANKVVIVGPDGNITASSTATESMILNGGGGGSTPEPTDDPTKPSTGIVGVRINYSTSVITPTDDAATANFNTFHMYGGRKRCMVDDQGNIVAFYGESNYEDNPLNGYQILVYQPKFYYKRTVLSSKNTSYGIIPTEEIIQLSDIARVGYKLHPLFIDANNNELDYVLLSAYEGSIDASDSTSFQDIVYPDFTNMKLSSVSEAKPISGFNNKLTILEGEQLANNRGEGWHITTSKVISAQQMLAMVEISLNLQQYFYKGICDLQAGDNSELFAATTGSTQSLGNASGMAASTKFEYNGETHTETTNGKVAISYRGYENLFGNMWDEIGDLLINNVSSSKHIPYICNNFNYSNTVTNDYTQLGFTTPPANGWISGFSYDTNNDWLFIPIEMNSNANSITPVGDYNFSAQVSSGTQTYIYGGPWFGAENNGLFYYAVRQTIATGGKNVGARLLYIPQKGTSTYTTNINKWRANISG